MRLLLVLVVACLQAAAYAESDKRPNVILIVTDDQGYADMSCHGNPWLRTPNLDRLASQGVSLRDYHVDPVCTPTRAALLTGRYSLRTGAWHVVQGRQLLGRDETTLADVFKHSGYATAMFGKWHLGDNYPYAPQYRGFDRVVCHKAGGVDEIGNPADNDYHDDTYFRNGKPEQFDGYCTNVWFDELLKFIDDCEAQREGTPFFAYLALNAMHSPFTVEEKYSQPFLEQGVPEDRAIFYGMISNFDENLGRLMARLETDQLAENTIVIFMGDNGTAAGAAGTYNTRDGFNAGMRGWKGTMYEGGHRVACFVRWPGHFESGTVVDQLTAHIDWMPTLAELCGLHTDPQDLDGRSLVPLLNGDTHDWSDRVIFIERQNDNLYKYDATSRQAKTAVLSQRWRFANGELFDIEADPGQQNNVAHQHPSIVAKLTRLHAKWFDDVTSHDGKLAPFVVGHEKENPTTMTVRDWHPTTGNVIWKQDQLTDDDLKIDGFWMLEVDKSGFYEIWLTRFPDDNPKPMKATSAQIQIGHNTLHKACKESDTWVKFQMKLSEGRKKLQTRLVSPDGSYRGAYFVSFTRLSD